MILSVLTEDNLLNYSGWTFKTALYRLGHLDTITIEMIVVITSLIWLGLLLNNIYEED